MYTGNDANLRDLQVQITALTGRVNTVDGLNWRIRLRVRWLSCLARSRACGAT